MTAMPTRTPTRAGLIGFALAAAVSGLALACAGSANAQSYEWSPQKTATRLTGTITFLPTLGNGASFQCKLVLNFRTGNVKRGADALPVIRSATVKGRGCESVKLSGLPWYVGADGPASASFSRFGWENGVESCEMVDGAPFVANSDGTWTFNSSECINGSLTSSPPVSIVARP
jgi:hypothetical protein